MAVAVLALTGCAAKGPGGDGPAVSPAQASIPFSEFRSIYDWRADGTAGIYIQSDDRHWYHATFMSPCENLPFTEHVGFRTTPPLPLDKFDSITVRGENCFFKSLEKAAGPPGANPAKPTG
jgi:hypothetical protein